MLSTVEQLLQLGLTAANIRTIKGGLNSARAKLIVFGLKKRAIRQRAERMLDAQSWLVAALFLRQDAIVGRLALKQATFARFTSPLSSVLPSDRLRIEYTVATRLTQAKPGSSYRVKAMVSIRDMPLIHSDVSPHLQPYLRIETEATTPSRLCDSRD